MQDHLRRMCHSKDSWQNMVHWRRKWQPIPVFLSGEPNGQYKKAKVYDIGRWDSQVGWCPISYWGRVERAAAAAAAAAKSFQSCQTLCDPIGGSPLGSTLPGILQARTLQWVATSFSNAWKWKVKVKSLSRVQLFMTPWTAAYRFWCPWDSPGKSTGVGCQCLLPSRGQLLLIIASKRMKCLGQSENDTQFGYIWWWNECPMMKEQYCIGTWNISSINQSKWMWSSRTW